MLPATGTEESSQATIATQEPLQATTSIQEPSRTSTRAYKPTRKRAQSTVPPTKQPKRPRSQRASSAALAKPIRLRLVHRAPEPVIEEGEDKQGLELAETIQNTPIEDNGQADATQFTIEDGDAVEATPNAPIEGEDCEENSVEFLSTWKAIAGKEQLPGVRSVVLREGSFSLYCIETWKQQTIRRLLPRCFKVVKLEAVSSYERCKQLDERPQDITTTSDIYAVVAVLKAWHKQWPRRSLSVRITLYLEELKESDTSGPTTAPQIQSIPRRSSSQRTATQVQLATLPDVLQSEQLAGNLMPAIADRWPCTSGGCPNKGKTCWRNQKPNAPDKPEHHYPIPAELFRRWSKEIRDDVSTVEHPSQEIIVALVAWRERDRRKRTKESLPKTDGSANLSTTNTLIQALLVSQLRQMNQQPASLQLAQPTCLMSSSPLRSNRDPRDVLAEFFDWLITQPGFNSQRQLEVFKRIKDKLLDEDWTVDLLKDKRDSIGITNEIWESYGFKLGTLASIRSKISNFKQQRPQSSE